MTEKKLYLKSMIPPWLVWLNGWSTNRPANPKVTGLIPSQGTWLAVLQLMFFSHIDVSLPFTLPSPLSENKLIKI